MELWNSWGAPTSFKADKNHEQSKHHEPYWFVMFFVDFLSGSLGFYRFVLVALSNIRFLMAILPFQGLFSEAYVRERFLEDPLMTNTEFHSTRIVSRVPSPEELHTPPYRSSRIWESKLRNASSGKRRVSFQNALCIGYRLEAMPLEPTSPEQEKPDGGQGGRPQPKMLGQGRVAAQLRAQVAAAQVIIIRPQPTRIESTYIDEKG